MPGGVRGGVRLHKLNGIKMNDVYTNVKRHWKTAITPYSSRSARARVRVNTTAYVCVWNRNFWFALQSP